MLIKCYGTRGSIAVSGKEYQKYGGDTTCFTVTSKKGDVIIIDAGTGIRQLGNELVNSTINKFSILFTHAHWDHLFGLPFFKPMFFSKFEIDMYGCPFTSDYTLKDLIMKTMIPPHFPVTADVFNAKLNYINKCYSGFEIGGIQIIPIQLSHPNQGVGYKFIEDNKSFVLLTDNELGYRHEGGLDPIDYERDCSNADLLFHDGEYTPEEYPTKTTWGHSTYKDAVNLALKANVKKLGIVHHNQDRTDKEVDIIAKESKALAKKAKSKLDCFAVHQGQEITL